MAPVNPTSAQKVWFCARKGFKRAVGKPQARKNAVFCALEGGKVPFGRPKARKNANFALERAEKCGSGGQKRATTRLLRSRRPNNGYWEDLPRTKSLFLSSKSPKTWEKLPKKGQNGHFCPQKPLKWRFWRAKKDKNLNFVLEQAQKLAKVDSKRTKSPLLSSGRRKMAVGKPEKPLPAIHLPHLICTNTSGLMQSSDEDSKRSRELFRTDFHSLCYVSYCVSPLQRRRRGA